MASASTDIASYSDALVVLGTAAVIVPLVRKSGVSPVLGYLLAGAILGPLGLGAFIHQIPALYWFTVVDQSHVSGIAELGIVFLLFMIGLELSFQRLRTMRRLILGLGGMQVVLTSIVVAAIAMAMEVPSTVALVIGMSVSLSSTAIVLELLSSAGRMATSVGRASFAVLLAQDIAVVPILMFIAIAGGGGDGPVWMTLARALLQAAAAITVIIVLGRVAAKPLFRLVGSTRSTEIFIAAVLFVIVFSGVIAHAAGLSMALGAFVAGILLAETEYGKSIEATIEPFKGLLLGIFFFTVGMSIDFREMLREPLLLVACVVGLIVTKAIVLTLLGRLYRLSWHSAIETGLLLGPGGEFAFVGLGMAAGLHLINPRVTGFILAAVAITMALTPLLAAAGRKIATKLHDETVTDPKLAIKPPEDEAHAIIVGYGRVGQVVSSLFKELDVPFVATDYDPHVVTRARRAGDTVYFGDAADPDYLRLCGLDKATGVIITINARESIDAIVAEVRAQRPDVLIVSRAKDALHASHLYSVGASDAVPETIEASLQLSEAALVGLGVPTGLAIAAIHEQRDVFRGALQKAAREAGRSESYAIRRKHGRVT
ncbi:CPA2 family monovalent cation:H+ antiporter-2 [Rhizomicrobium palustre]|uniref:CPA2 family monovalent cation:H+ antiporter-2 n=1 Tax=Rhizomicrobium palustre TaxID=189966 RepID=A0A846MWE7_9PROT|nr:cation:proton antiporter [Rhizomicrobium palustre]NIK87360.1 CPA2 family monovalent cation:H+ antiporter-2 [Rhizomicrobium palustre]